MALWRQTPEYRIWLEKSRENRIRLKAKYRREKGVATREEKAAASKQRRLAMAKADAHVKLYRSLAEALHQAHVVRYHLALRDRAKYQRRWQTDPKRERDRVRKYKAALPDAYVISNIKAMGISPEQITPDLVALKREAMSFRRLSLQAKTILTNHNKETHESLTKHT